AIAIGGDLRGWGDATRDLVEIEADGTRAAPQRLGGNETPGGPEVCAHHALRAEGHVINHHRSAGRRRDGHEGRAATAAAWPAPDGGFPWHRHGAAVRSCPRTRLLRWLHGRQPSRAHPAESRSAT